MAILESRACDECTVLPAAFRDPSSDSWLCVRCTDYRAGTEHGRALVAREQLDNAISELRGAGLEPAQITLLCTHALDGQAARASDLLPSGVRPDEPRPYVSRFTPIRES